ncbi:MAG: pyridoxamine 5-phosphate oxidase-related FMN-binding protein, partial [Actinomycetia bacterium]|nr:pyridoxamine 5-phosphate oxidase-related FMN-binding protein [Actinomycetes bacterium]
RPTTIGTSEPYVVVIRTGLRVDLGGEVSEASAVLTWAEFRDARPDLAEPGKALLYQFGVGLAFLGTTRRDGRPRVHPMCPVIAADGLFGLIIPSPKLGDLVRDGHYAMHSFPCPQNEDAFYITGNAQRADPRFRDAIETAFLGERSWDIAPPGFDEQSLIEFRIDSCLLTTTTGHGDHDPQHTIWNASG